MPWIRNRKTGETKWVDDPASAPARGPAEGLPGGPEPIIRAAPKVSADASPYQKGQDAISNAREPRRGWPMKRWRGASRKRSPAFP